MTDKEQKVVLQVQVAIDNLESVVLVLGEKLYMRSGAYMESKQGIGEEEEYTNLRDYLDELLNINY